MQWRFGVRTFKSVVGVMGAVVPVLYCGGLLYYFLDLSGSVHEAWGIGLGPTVLGLGAVGLLFCIPLLMKIVRIFARPHPSVSGSGPGGSKRDDEGGFDADAAIARYMAERSTEVASAARSLHTSSGPPKRPGFGRRTGG
jgi:hypothetical protein